MTAGRRYIPPAAACVPDLIVIEFIMKGRVGSEIDIISEQLLSVLVHKPFILRGRFPELAKVRVDRAYPDRVIV